MATQAMDNTVADLGEDALIKHLTDALPAGDGVVIGVGDDCAVVEPLQRGWRQLLKTDCVVEGVHFLPEAPAEQVGWKAMARAISDMAAMGGMPRHALITLMLPKTCKVAYVEALYAGLCKCARRYQTAVVGGETTSGPLVMISVAMTGAVPARKVLRRDGAKPGDAIYVTGRLGGSIHGRHLVFEPRLEQAQWLAASFPVHAMMDLSDGLVRDLPRMAQLSGMEGAFVIWEDKLPVHEGCTPVQALADGEDYELLFTVPSRLSKPLELAWSQQFPELKLTQVGRFLRKGEKMPLEKWSGGWDHFSA